MAYLSYTLDNSVIFLEIGELPCQIMTLGVFFLFVDTAEDSSVHTLIVHTSL